MKKASGLFVLAAGCVWWVQLAGCGDGAVIELRYDRPPQYEVPATIKRLGIAEFGGRTARDRQWGHIASDRLAASLDAYNRKYNRYELVDRKRLKAIMDERDLQVMISDTATAGRAGRIAKVDAMIYGSVKVTTRDERGTRTGFNPLSRSVKVVSYTRRYCLTAVNFTMDDIRTGKTLASVSTTREFDSEEDRAKSSGKGAVGSAKRYLGFGGGPPPPTDQIVNQLIEQCVREFVTKISPHEVVVREKLGGGKSKIVGTANKLALAGDHAEALELYDGAIRANPQDHAAVFNAGVMHEAMGNLSRAEAFYDRAFRIEPKEQYVFARKRVRVAGK